MQTINDLASKSLGSENSYAVWTDSFDPSLLNPIPRNLARQELGIVGDEWKYGMDVWTCHESTFLLDSGAPVAGTLKFVYPSYTEMMIESKSMKLYLNSFDMCKMGATVGEAIKNYEYQIKDDLSSALDTSNFSCQFFSSSNFFNTKKYNILKGSLPLESLIDISDIEISDYFGEWNHTQAETAGIEGIHKVHTNILRSRCRHTKQKDTGTAVIRYSSKCLITPESLFKGVASLREMNKFHEETVEVMYNNLSKVLFAADPYARLTVAFLYSRRGSLDISPIRSSDRCFMFEKFTDCSILSEKVQGQ